MSNLTRRDVLRAAGAAAAVAAAPHVLRGAAPATAPALAGGAGEDAIDVAIIGAGDHGRHLISHCVKIPGVRLAAVCDIWPYARNYASRLLQKYKHPARPYVDYREMLGAEKGLHAAVVATPDWMHAEQTIACLKAGLHVYCEKEMAITVEDCRRVAATARETGKLLQVGRQHRSNARYQAALELIDKQKALGRLTGAGGQWHGHTRAPQPWPAEGVCDEGTLRKYGYDTMERLRGWRWLEKYSAGEMAGLGSHQVDVFNWFLGSPPKAVYASGGLDYYGQYELYDNIRCVLEWDYAWLGRTTTVRAAYDINTTTEVGGFFETFTGTEGTLTISEIDARGGLLRDRQTPVAEWEKALVPVKTVDVAARAYGPLGDGEGDAARPVYWRHLKNFFDAIRGKAKLTCPAEVGLTAAVTVLRAIESMKTGKRIELKPEDFRV